MAGDPVAIRDTQEYLLSQLAKAHEGERLIVVLDPERRLKLNDDLRSSKRRWRVYQYAENDLDFRASYGDGPDDPNQPHILWVTPSPFRRGQADRLDLSYLADILRRADRIYDVSLAGILRVLVPGEIFPEGGLKTYGEVLSSHLDTLVAGHGELRRQIGTRPPLDLHHVRALAIHCIQPDLAVTECLFDQANVLEGLRQYLGLAWSVKIGDTTLPLLREQLLAGSPVPADSLRPWIQAAPDDIALAVYLYRALKSYGVPNPLNQLRGLSLLTVDPMALQPTLDTALKMWDDASLRPRLIARAEAVLAPERLPDLVALLPLSGTTALIEAMKREQAPGILYGLAERLLSQLTAQDVPMSPAETLASPTIDLPESQYTGRVRAALTILREIAFVKDVLGRRSSPAPDLATLVDGYVGSGAYRLEMACAIALEQTKLIVSPSVRQSLTNTLEALRLQVYAHLNTLDASLVALIEPDPAAFWNHPRLSTNVIPDMALKAGLRPTAENSLWILVFDGMRWDSWREVIRPCLLEHFEIINEEKAYLSPLPSITSIARTGLLAGCPPAGWRGPDGRFTTNEEALVARLFNVSASDAEERIRFETKSEFGALHVQMPYDLNRRPINVLIYKISDGWIHDFQGDLVALNKRIIQEVREVVSDLQAVIQDGDAIVLASDHGFAELDASAKIKVTDAGDQVIYRYLVDLDNAAGLRVPGLQEHFYTVAKGRAWFLRERGRYTRYSHGGVTLAEMAVPGLVLRRITEPSVKLQLTGLPEHLTVGEKETQSITLLLKNAGNRPTEYVLTFSTNTDPQGDEQHGALGAAGSSFARVCLHAPV